ncbi:Protein kinase-like domain superfamily [Sesbania bispinosa]|nr:Protein kinase-like domain superfamily [Sesbania bispinosa]
MVPSWFRLDQLISNRYFQCILNGIEVMKMSNNADSLDGFFSVDGKYKGPSSTCTSLKIAASVGLGLALTAMVLLTIIFIRWLRRPHGWEEHKRFSSWLLPINSGCKTRLFSCKSTSQNSSTFGSHKSNNVHSPSSYHSPRGPEKFFPFIELQQATQNFDEKRVIGVGGFGKVYLGTLRDGTKLL